MIFAERRISDRVHVTQMGDVYHIRNLETHQTIHYTADEVLDHLFADDGGLYLEGSIYNIELTPEEYTQIRKLVSGLLDN